MESIVISSEKTVPPVGHIRRRYDAEILVIVEQVGTDPRPVILCDGIHKQLRQAMTNIQEFFKRRRVFADVVMMHVYLAKEGHFREMKRS